MARTNFYRVLILNFISSMIIALITANIIIAFDFNGGVYLGILFGLYFFVGYGMNNLVEAREIPNNYQRFVYALILMAIFDIAFILIVPLLFGPDAIPPTKNYALNLSGSVVNIPVGKEFYCIVIAVVMLIYNFIMYRRTGDIFD